MALERLDSHMGGKMYLCTPYMKINPAWIIDLKTNTQISGRKQENTFGVGKDFLDKAQKALSIRGKKILSGLHQN